MTDVRGQQKQEKDEGHNHESTKKGKHENIRQDPQDKQDELQVAQTAASRVPRYRIARNGTP